jgi:carotenoid cleavage dioxygenase
MAARPSEITNLYIKGMFAPVHHEIAADDLPVLGELPPDLAGMFLRNSPNARFPPEGRYHWFDGDGMLHGMRIQGGKASYRNRWVRTRDFLLEEQAGRALFTGLMMPLQRDNPHGPVKNASNTDVVFHAGRLLSLSWLGGEPYEVNPTDLSTVGAYRYGGALECGFASHPKVDPVTGEMVFIDYSAIKPPYLRAGVVSAKGELVRVVPIDLPGPRLLHDIAITEHYTILLDFPMTWDREALKHGKRKVIFDRSLPSRFGVLPRHGGAGDVRWLETSPCYMYHTINAYEEGSEIVLTGCRIENPMPSAPGAASGTTATLDILELVPFMHRFRLDLSTGTIREEALDDVPSEFARMNSTRLGQKTRYSYNPRIAPRPTLLFDGIIKYDAETGRSETYAYGKGRYGGEVVFASRPGGAAEDDGWIVTFTYDEHEDRSEFVVIDARNVPGGPIARVPIPQRVPIGFHGTWIDEADLTGQAASI